MTGPEPGDLAEIETLNDDTHVCRFDETRGWCELATNWSPARHTIVAIRRLSVVPTDSLEATIEAAAWPGDDRRIRWTAAFLVARKAYGEDAPMGEVMGRLLREADAEVAAVRADTAGSERQIAAVRLALDMEGDVHDRGDFDRGIQAACSRIRRAMDDPESFLNPTPAVGEQEEKP